MPAAASLLFAFMACAVCIALLAAYSHSLGPLLRALANALNIGIPTGLFGSIHPFGFLVSGIRSLDSAINAALVQGVEGTVWAWKQVLHANAVLLNDLSAVVGDLAGATEQTLRNLWRHRIPLLINASLGGLLGLIYGFRRQLAHLAAQAWHTTTIVTHTVTAPVVKEITRVERLVTHETKVVVYRVQGAIAIPLPRIGPLERDLSNAWKRIRSLGKDLAPAALAGLVLAAVLRELPHLNCKNNRNLGKHLCSWPVKAFEDLLGGVLDVLVFTQTCLLFEAMDTLAHAVSPLVIDGTVELQKLFVCRSLSPPPPLALAYNYAPAPVNTIAL